MFSFDQHTLSEALSADLPMILEEHQQLLQKVSVKEIAALALLMQEAKRIFITGAGRTGLMMKAAAMRFMHMGFTVHVVGETTTPAILKGDLLLAASGSGTTSSIVKAAEKAHAAGAAVAALSTTTQSPLAALAQFVLLIPAAQKQDFNGTISRQYAGSLFEQSILLIADALFQTIWKLSDAAPEEVWKRHANME
ncbi:6-phospho-3-hexuloisomerase [Chitinophaga pinensis]|uniref:6-phospho 3-hexuloisomerase n=1 Tax=Chitinophaga pinensis (strain ATCC 43595 / DSM 2588 / LMG 13176 / NBRC 15968 / NCIMB 11800 / UQM 2034) TaxID=485918 RepID=A0A979H050_CHIPD|nr:6-phospho-3-hexuloisomerase [Chitinophaga pinensis]ACU63095.1 6-phospho 3-hexuloisomerase [Chitinophaga pinensis DSM 2588]